MRPPSWIAKFALTAGLAACGDGTGPSQPRDLVIVGSARDANGEYLANYSVGVTVERVNNGEWLVLGHDDVAGNGSFSIPIVAVPELEQGDSLVLLMTVAECRGLAPVRRTLGTRDLADVLGDTLRVELTVDSTTGGARLGTGAFCAAGYDWPDHYAKFWVGLDIQDVADSIRGRWEIAYLTTRVTERGHFAGVRRGDTLVLELRIEDFPRCAPGHRLWVLIGADDVLGEAWYQSLGPCRAYDSSFWFVNEDVAWWPPDDGGA
jgi:hypothetical protein